MQSDPLQSKTLLTAGAVTLALAYALATRTTQDKHKLLLGDKKPRKIHTLDARSLVLGDLRERMANGPRVFDWILEHSLRYDGEPWRVTVPGQPEMVMITMPEAIEEITITQFENFPKGQFKLEYLEDMFGRGLLASDGARWHHQRKASVRFFSAKTLRTVMTHTMQKNMDKVYKVIDQSTGSSAKQVDLKQLFLEFTIDTFAELGMGAQLNCIGAEEPHPFHTALDTVAPIISRRLRLPMWFWKTERWLNVGKEAELRKHMDIVYAWLEETIQKSFQTINAKREKAQGVEEADGAEKTQSVIELFLQHGHEDAEGLQPSDLTDFLLTFVIGARDTTAATLCWLVYTLSKHPEIEENIRAEMKSKLGSETIPFLTSDHAKRLTYLEATIQETLRLYPSVPFTSRQATQDTVLCGDIVIRKDEIVGFSAWAMARHPRIWGPDAAEFKPERWIDDATGQIRQFPATKFFTFSAGPRACIGMSLAMLELRVVAANLLHRYHFDVDPSNDGSYEVAPTLNIKLPLLARATRVADAA